MNNDSKLTLENIFSLEGKGILITGAAGLLGSAHTEAVAAAAGIPIIIDINKSASEKLAEQIKQKYGLQPFVSNADITKESDLIELRDRLLDSKIKISGLINNAANNPKVESASDSAFSRIENFPDKQWNEDLDVGLKGAFLCCKIFGSHMALNKEGVIVNILSEYGLHAPDQRLYRVAGLEESLQPVKPVTYTVTKSGLLGLTKYFASYWAESGVRVNSLTVSGIFNNQNPDFVRKYTDRVPLGRMSNTADYQGAIIFLCSEASKFMTGSNLVIDGGKSCC